MAKDTLFYRLHLSLRDQGSQVLDLECAKPASGSEAPAGVHRSRVRVEDSRRLEDKRTGWLGFVFQWPGFPFPHLHSRKLFLPASPGRLLLDPCW